METEHLLNNLANTFDTSNHNQSRELLKKIISLAAEKLGSSKNSNDLSPSKSLRSINFVKNLFDQKANKLKRKFISKAKLRRTALKKIANRNKKIHENFIRTTQLKQLTIDDKRIQLRNNTPFQFENEEHKLQSHGQEQENFPLYLNKEKCPRDKSNSKEQKGVKNIKFYRKLLCEKFKKARKNFENYLKSSFKESQTDDFTCPICIETLIDPVSTICGHSFCFRCLDESLLFGSNCPVCRLHIKGCEIVPCTYLKEFIKIKCTEFLEDEQAIENYRQRAKQYEEWKNDRFLNPSALKEGDLLDVRDTENIWCKATILKIYTVNEKVSSILVHYLQWAKIYDEIIEIKSIRLAPKDYFSTRTDIPRYNLGSGQENLRGAVITGNNSQGILRSNNDDLAFSNILQLSNLRNRISSLQNNVINHLVPPPPYNRVSFLHHVIPDNNDSEEPMSDALYPNEENEEDSQYDQSSIGSFVFAPIEANSVYQYSESEDEQNYEEIGQPYLNHQSFVSMRGNSEQEEQDNDEEEYWNARPEAFSEDYQNEEMQDPFYNIQSLSPQYQQNIAVEQQQFEIDENSYGENSYSQ